MTQSFHFELDAASFRGEPRRRDHAWNWSCKMPRRNAAMLRVGFSALAGAGDLVVTLAVAATVQILYHWVAYVWNGMGVANLEACIFVAALFFLSNTLRGEYSITRYLTLQGRGVTTFGLWNLSFLCALALAFFIKSAEETSRLGLALFYVAGFAAIYAERAALTHFVRRDAAKGGVAARRVLLVGFEDELAAFDRRRQPWTNGMHVVAAAVLRDSEATLDDDLALAAASARMLKPDDVFILAPWSRTEVIDSCVNAFLRVPAQLHLGPESVLDRFVDARIDKIGTIASLSLSDHALEPMEILAKRAFDIAFAAAALVALSPLLGLFALAIKLDSPGPVLFFQRRHGFNREQFRIAKFRSMTVMEDGRNIRQATANDDRITRVGRIMRRWNIDELPQLINVLRGEMSIVGPRPHALAHDQLFERRIALYARRHNVKPGITGWAQVNGLRGEIDSPEKIRARVDHDLHYIDNWSLPLDVWIILLTVFSRKAYRNAQ